MLLRFSLGCCLISDKPGPKDETPLDVNAITPPDKPPDPEPELTQEQKEQQEQHRIKILREKLVAFNIVPSDKNIQMFQQLFDVKTPLQLTVLPQKPDVTHVLCLAAVAKIVKPFFPDPERPSLAQFFYENTVLAMRSYKGTFVSMFQRIFEQNPPADMLVPNQLPNVVPQDTPRKGFFSRAKDEWSNKE